ncbi:hypothetical protein ET989_13285 [Propioniciclava sinopodophylli]|uniref:Mrr-like domain-containing protein n=1 Tax=Propioniciclava sinopodophylli TaxID=1837344 RepID=A0A4Q9KB12_9ACTN|nr:hypothetical protein ET989_13285 [Propioniciclava sinopodophylli]
MVAYFRLDPTLAAEYDLVERWPNWNHNEGTHDSGIDLVARTTATGEWTAMIPGRGCRPPQLHLRQRWRDPLPAPRDRGCRCSTRWRQRP